MKEFNTTGLCNPKKHYMVDISNKLDDIKKLVKKLKVKITQFMEHIVLRRQKEK